MFLFKFRDVGCFRDSHNKVFPSKIIRRKEDAVKIIRDVLEFDPGDLRIHRDRHNPNKHCIVGWTVYGYIHKIPWYKVPKLLFRKFT